MGIFQIKTFAFGKPLADNPLFSESHEYALSKPFSDAYNVSDAPSLEPGKALTDNVSGVGDYVLILAKKVLGDAFAARDQINILAVSKSLAETGLDVGEANAFVFGKPLNDQPLTSDSITSFGTEKELHDSIFVTDEVDGEATILDDQEMQYIKQITDTVFVGDSALIQRIYSRGFFNRVAVAEVISVSGEGNLAETQTATDITNMVTGKHIYDIPVAADTLAFAFSSARADSALLGDVNEVAFNKTLLELTSTADAGSLRSQGYADFTYFREDFVGASRTF